MKIRQNVEKCAKFEILPNFHLYTDFGEVFVSEFCRNSVGILSEFCRNLVGIWGHPRNENIKCTRNHILQIPTNSDTKTSRQNPKEGAKRIFGFFVVFGKFRPKVQISVNMKKVPSSRLGRWVSRRGGFSCPCAPGSGGGAWGCV